MKEKIKARLAELERAEQETEKQLYAIRAVIGEMRALLQVEDTNAGHTDTAHTQPD